jgi:TonB-linked SusC/RagA family outer membrane protein
MPSSFVRVARPAAGALLFAAMLPGVPGVRARAAGQPAAQPAAQTGTVRGRVVEAGSQRPVSDAQVQIVGTTAGAITNPAGEFTISNVPVGARTLRVRRIGFTATDRAVAVTAGTTRADVELAASATRLDQVVVTAGNQTVSQRSVGTAQQTVAGAEIAETQRTNFVNSLQGRVAGVEVTSTSGVPGASASITIRGVSSISGSNQPLMIVDGAPIDNKTLNTSVFAGTDPFTNRGVDFSNRASDLNPEDIESITVLKGPEAAALYGLDAANGAIIITTKRGRPGTGGFTYSNNFRLETVRQGPEVQRVYGPTTLAGAALGSFSYFGDPYPDGTKHFDNVGEFFQRGLNQTHNIAFSGAAPDNRVNYRVAGTLLRAAGVVPTGVYNRANLTGASGGQVTRWLQADLSMNYATVDNQQPFKGDIGPLIGLMLWPSTDDATQWLTPAGTRRRVTALTAAGEIDNPFFNLNKNRANSTNTRLISTLTMTATPLSWGTLQTILSSDNVNNQNQIVLHPESFAAGNTNGRLNEVDDVTRNLSAQTTFRVNEREVARHLKVSGTLGNRIYDWRTDFDAIAGLDFLDPNFVSINNTNNAQRLSRTTLVRRRVMSAFSEARLAYRDYLFLNVQGTNDWTSTIPRQANSFFYPAAQLAFVFSDAMPRRPGFLSSGKLRAAVGDAGKDAAAYAYAAALESKATTAGGYGYGFTGPNPNLRPEFTRSYEFGTDLGLFNDRLSVSATYWRKQTRDQIVRDIRGSYGTGFVLFNLNGAVTRNSGYELTVNGTPLQRAGGLTWDVTANFDRTRGYTLRLPNALPESYVSDTWLFGNVRAGTAPGLSTRSLTGQFYLRSNQGELLIDPATGLPLRSTSFIDAGYDRQPDFTLGLNNSFRYRRLSLSFLLDMRRGGDVYNATQHFLTARGLSPRTLDRQAPRVINGVLRDGLENSATPTRNTIVVIPEVQNQFYTGMSEELFIEKDINWLRLRDLVLRYRLPARVGRNASVFAQGTDLLLLTNYTGLDPVVNGNTAAVGGSGAAGIDYGNFPLPRGYNMGITIGF